jgi:hypothetical protein
MRIRKKIAFVLHFAEWMDIIAVEIAEQLGILRGVSKEFVQYTSGV